MVSLSPGRRARVVLLSVVGGSILLILFRARSALYPFIGGVFLVYLLLPLVNLFQEAMPRPLQGRNLARPLAIVLTYLLVILILVGFFAVFVPLITDQVGQLIEASGQYTLQLLQNAKGFNQGVIDEWLEQYRDVVPQWIQDAISDNVQELTATLTNTMQNIVSWLAKALQRAVGSALDVVTSTVSFVFGLIIIPFWMFYVLNDEHKIMDTLYSLIPRQLRADVRSLQDIVNHVLSSYLRGQLLLCLFVGSMATVGLLVLGVHFSLVLGTVAGILEIVPNIGPVLGAIPAVLVALLKSPSLALKTALLFFTIQQVENLLLVPKVAGATVKLHPTITMLVMVIGAEVAGVWGVVLAVPLTAIARYVVHYLYLRSGEEQITPEQALAAVLPAEEAHLARAAWRERIRQWWQPHQERLVPVRRWAAKLIQQLVLWGYLVTQRLRAWRDNLQKTSKSDQEITR